MIAGTVNDWLIDRESTFDQFAALSLERFKAMTPEQEQAHTRWQRLHMEYVQRMHERAKGPRVPMGLATIERRPCG